MHMFICAYIHRHVETHIYIHVCVIFVLSIEVWLLQQLALRMRFVPAAQLIIAFVIIQMRWTMCLLLGVICAMLVHMLNHLYMSAAGGLKYLF